MEHENEIEENHEGMIEGKIDDLILSDKGSPFVKETVPVHTIFVIKNGTIDIGGPEHLDQKRYSYRLHSRIDGVACVDYDKTNITPIVKDILNRQHTFIEIKYLTGIAWGVGIMFFAMLLIGYLNYGRGAVDFAPVKADIISEIRKSYSAISSSQLVSPQKPISTGSGAAIMSEGFGSTPAMPTSTGGVKYKAYFNDTPMPDNMQPSQEELQHIVKEQVKSKPKTRPTVSGPAVIEEEEEGGS